MSEKYFPTKEEKEKAKSMITPVQAEASRLRERILWPPGADPETIREFSESYKFAPGEMYQEHSFKIKGRDCSIFSLSPIEISDNSRVRIGGSYLRDTEQEAIIQQFGPLIKAYHQIDRLNFQTEQKLKTEKMLKPHKKSKEKIAA